jgi:cysteinyl-tRNA synthetase
VRKDPDYGKLSRRSLEAMMSAECGLGAGEKEDPMDFALWKASKPGEPFWESPWGEGRPGWHIECSAMSLKYLGDQIDIHGGGQDLIFPHHENEIAQSESFTGKKPFVKYWLHNGLVQLGEEKMSKSLGNLVTIKQALAKYSPDAIRIFILSSHYRSPLTYSEEGLEAAERGAERLRRVVSRENPAGKEAFNAEPYRQQFIEAMDDDFNTAQALGVLFDLASTINQAGDAGISIGQAQSTLTSLAREVLGLTLTEELAVDINAPIEISAAEAKSWQLDTTKLSIGKLIELRQQFREDKKWQLADRIRLYLDKKGLILEDTPKGTVCKRKR